VQMSEKSELAARKRKGTREIGYIKRKRFG